LEKSLGVFVGCILNSFTVFFFNSDIVYFYCPCSVGVAD